MPGIPHVPGHVQGPAHDDQLVDLAFHPGLVLERPRQVRERPGHEQRHRLRSVQDRPGEELLARQLRQRRLDLRPLVQHGQVVHGVGTHPPAERERMYPLQPATGHRHIGASAQVEDLAGGRERRL